MSTRRIVSQAHVRSVYRAKCCSADEAAPPLQALESPLFCGVSGWYLAQGDIHRDTDWFTATIPAGGVLEVTLASELDTRLAQIGPQDCASVTIQQEVLSDDCSEPTLTVAGEPDATVWLWVSPAGYCTYLPFDATEYAYVLVSNLDVVAVEDRSWSAVKALFD